MKKLYNAIGLMSGTSSDGVDCSIIQSDGDTKYSVIYDMYFPYDSNLRIKLTVLREKITTHKDLQDLQEEINDIEKQITIFHGKVVNKTIEESKLNNKEIDLIGFHGHTIYHNAQEKKTHQIGDGKFLSNICDKSVVYDFRKNDIINGGQGAPLTPIFHKILVNQKKIKMPVVVLNIGGISNWTLIKSNNEQDICSSDIGPGNCLIDRWIKINSKFDYDNNGDISKQGKINKQILNQAIDNWDSAFYLNEKKLNKSYDVNDFDLSFLRGLSLEDGAATVTEFTSHLISENLNKMKNVNKIIICGGGRKNKYLLDKISEKTKYKIELIDNYGINGDYVESQAFALLAIRSLFNLPITFPKTTGCLKSSTGGIIIKN